MAKRVKSGKSSQIGSAAAGSLRLPSVDFRFVSAQTGAVMVEMED